MVASLFERIGAERVAAIVRLFYLKCVDDPMLAHFFMHIDHERLVAQQLQFTSNLLGGPRVYHGPSLPDAHASFTIRPPHFSRRQMLLSECMDEQGLDPGLSSAWLALEERLRPLIVNQGTGCRSP